MANIINVEAFSAGGHKPRPSCVTLELVYISNAYSTHSLVNRHAAISAQKKAFG